MAEGTKPLERRYTRLSEAAAELGITERELLYFGYHGLIYLCVDLYGHADDSKCRIVDKEYKGSILPWSWPSGLVEVLPEDVRLILRGDKVTASEFSRCEGAVAVELSPEATFDANDLVIVDDELARFAEWNSRQPKTSKRSEDRDRKLQEAANQLVSEWRQQGRKVLSKRDIAIALAKSDAWQDMTKDRIERIIRVKW